MRNFKYFIFSPKQQQLQDFNNSMSQLNDQNILLRAQLSAAGGNGTIGNFSHHENNNNHHHDQIEQLQNQVQLLANENAHQKTQISFYESENHRLLEELNQLKMLQLSLKSESDQKQSNEVDERLVALTKDQENLLELLSDQDVKLKEYRRQLRSLGQNVEESDDE